MNDFEPRARQVPLKSPPREWRAQILAAATVHVSAAGAPPPPVSVRAWLQSLFWPHPRAWAGLAAVWLLILGLHFSRHETATTPAPVLAQATAPETPETRAQLRAQQELFVELMGPAEPKQAVRNRPPPGSPHTWRTELMAA